MLPGPGPVYIKTEKLLKNEQRSRDAAAAKKELIQVEWRKLIIIVRIPIYIYLLTTTPNSHTYTW